MISRVAMVTLTPDNPKALEIEGLPPLRFIKHVCESSVELQWLEHLWDHEN